MILNVKVLGKNDAVYDGFVDTDLLADVVDYTSDPDHDTASKFIEYTLRNSPLRRIILAEPELFEKMKSCIIGFKKQQHISNQQRQQTFKNREEQSRSRGFKHNNDKANPYTDTDNEKFISEEERIF